MDLLVIRHGIAVERDDWSGDDDLRPLTDDGVRKMRKGAQGIHSMVDTIDLLAASPLLRAQQTAHIVAAEFGIDVVDSLEELAPEQDPADITDWIATRLELDTVAIVGHEPHLSTLVTWLVCGDRRSRVELKKGAACLLRFDEEPRPGEGTLCWSLPPAQLRALAR